jgi:glycine dehydrogenase subunit 2
MTIFERSSVGRSAYTLPDEESLGFTPEDNLPGHLLRKEKASLPECSELDVVRHYTSLAGKNHSVDKGFYPLGSCTMKYNPKLNEKTASLEGFAYLHPYQPIPTLQGSLELMYKLDKLLCEITGMDSFSLQPAAGAHGELLGMLIVKKHFEKLGDSNRTKVIVPDSAHGTNPASAVMAGYEIVEVQSSSEGIVDLDELEELLDETVAAIMLTNPNTLGLFEKHICEIAEKAHEKGILLYYDGANLNAIMGKIKPGEMGFDIVHLNLHKTFSTPHGMGGPGSGPVGVKESLAGLLPVPRIEEADGKYILNEDCPDSVGRMRSFFGNFGVLVRAYTYISLMGSQGLRLASEMAVLNANYLKSLLTGMIPEGYPGVCKHEFVLDGGKLVSEYGIKTLDLAKRMLDYGVHPPTIYFPLIVDEALMIEPPETENKEALDRYAEIVKQILQEATDDVEIVKTAPHSVGTRRLNEALASRQLKTRWQKESTT